MEDEIKELQQFDLAAPWSPVAAAGHIRDLKKALATQKRRRDAARAETAQKHAERRRLERETSKLLWKRLNSREVS